MARFLIEVPHNPEVQACARVVQVFLASGSHFLAQADWGCKDGFHSAWMIVEAIDKEEARNIIPPAFRSQAKIVGLNKFTMEEIDSIMGVHHSSALAHGEVLHQLSK
jgi:hypothetical protein